MAEVLQQVILKKPIGLEYSSYVSVDHESLGHLPNEPVALAHSPNDVTLEGRDLPHGHGVAHLSLLSHNCGQGASCVKQADKHGHFHLLD